jgi:hypothetical protein
VTIAVSLLPIVRLPTGSPAAERPYQLSMERFM